MVEGSEKEAWCILCVYSACVCQCVKGENLSFFFFQLVGVPTLFAGLFCVGGVCMCVCVEVGHQGKEFNKSCRKRSGSAISERRPTTSKNSDKDSAGMSSSWKALSTRSEAS